jgi:hypothetical protein
VAARVPLDHRAGRGEDVAGRAVVLLEAHDVRVGVIALEVEDRAHVGAAEGVDRLVVVADDREVRRPRRELLDEQVLGAIDVLVLVDQHVAVAAPVGLAAVPIAEDLDHADDQAAEVGRSGALEERLVAQGGAHQGGLFAVGGEGIGRGFSGVLPPIEKGAQGLRRHLLVADVAVRESASAERELVGVVVDREAAR